MIPTPTVVCTEGERVPMTRIDVRTAPQIRSWLITEVAEYFSVEGRARFLEGTSPELRSLLERRRRDREDWASLALFHEALVVADGIAGRGDGRTCWDIGRFTAQHEAGVVRSFAMKFLRPTALISLATSLWQVHYRNAGRVVSKVSGPHSMRFSLVDYPTPHRAHCLAVAGWVQGALELGPRRSVLVRKVACRCEQASTCDYVVSWED